MKTVAAFANGVGGTILFGVTDEGAIVGLSAEEDRPQAADASTRLVTSTPAAALRDRVHPSSRARRETGDRFDRHAGSEPPYAAGATPEEMTYYVRRSTTTFAVMPDEVRTLTRRSQPQTPYPFELR